MNKKKFKELFIACWRHFTITGPRVYRTVCLQTYD